MVRLHIGQPGSGKTKELIAHADAALKSAKGSIVFIDESDEGILELHHDIRYINIANFPVESSHELLAFLYGLMSTNSDIEHMYLDGLLNVYIMTPEEIAQWLQAVKKLADNYNVAFDISYSLQGEVPAPLAPFVVS